MDLTGWKKSLGKRACYVLAAAFVYGLAPAVAMAADTAAPQAAPQPAVTEQAAAAPVEEVEPGSPDMGKRLFTGEVRFTNGGPPCISCHSTGIGALDGGVLGPNLTKVYADPSKNPLLNAVWINNPGTPVMGVIFSNRNVTDEEVGNLRAFFQQRSKAEKQTPPTGAFTIIGIGGSIGFLIIFSIIWGGMYRNRNKGTAHDALWRNYGGKGGR